MVFLAVSCFGKRFGVYKSKGRRWFSLYLFGDGGWFVAVQE
jgi:hypothetical protein